MTDRIDHAAEAHRLAILAEDSNTIGGMGELSALAQVHATLALVEQQRIANLIELAKGAAGAGARQAAYDALLDESGEGFDFKMIVRPDIARALGIEVSND